MGEKGRVCVTGAGGYVASWVVKLLLSKGYMVHGTVREPAGVKNAHLKKIENAQENLQLFKADLLDYDSLRVAIAGCSGVFHIASPVPSGNVGNPEIELVEPAVIGTLNVLKACKEEGIKRIVVVSSVAAVFVNPMWPPDRAMDEDCWTNIDCCKKSKDWLNWYYISKTSAEREALKYGEENGLDVLTVCPSFVLGPLLQPTINSTVIVFKKLFTGPSSCSEAIYRPNIWKTFCKAIWDMENYHCLVSGAYENIENNVWSIVDVRDVAEAVLMVYENPKTVGRYICNSHLIRFCNLAEKLQSMYPNFNYPKNYIEVDRELKLSSEKLKSLGWKQRTLEETLVDTVECYREAGFLTKD